jgi:hypothetical protein
MQRPEPIQRPLWAYTMYRTVEVILSSTKVHQEIHMRAAYSGQGERMYLRMFIHKLT